ncbi:MAG: tetratricopeptide repeat protein [Planctomycetes bacterium]|nr:tetratricopeptide repeat protein [Planctomycetota bacterium]
MKDIAATLEAVFAEIACPGVVEIAWPLKFEFHVSDVREQGHRFNLTCTLLAGESYVSDDVDELFPLLHGSMSKFREALRRHGMELPGPIVIERPIWRVEAGVRDMQPCRPLVGPGESIPYVSLLRPIDELAAGYRPAEEYEEILRRDPGNLRALMGKAEQGRREQKTGRVLSESEATDFRAVLKVDPWNESAHLWLNSPLRWKAHTRTALAHVRVERRNPHRWISLGWALSARHPNLADACFREAIARAPGDPFVEGTRAYHALHCNNGPALAEVCERVLRREPDCRWALHFRGVGRTLQGDPGGAIEDFNRQLEADPGNLEARFRRARALGRVERFDEALADLEVVSGRTTCSFTWEEAMETRAWVLECAGRFDEAIRVHRGLSFRGSGRTAIPRILMKQKRNAEARDALTLILPSNRDSSTAVALAEACLAMDDIAGAEAASTMAIERSKLWGRSRERREKALLCREQVWARARRGGESNSSG